MTTKNKRKIATTLAIAMAIAVTSSTVYMPVLAERDGQVATYCAEFYGDPSYDSSGGGIDVTYSIYYDERVLVDEAYIFSAPSYGNTNSAIYNACAVITGANIIAYYDRWCTNLIPNFEPGLTVPIGYQYWPDLSEQESEDMKYDLYLLMNTNVGHIGTTSADFRNGLDAYCANAGYDFTYYSMHQNSATVNLSTLKTALQQGKVGVVMCSKYNYITSIQPQPEGYDYIPKWNNDAGHMMMVYGYQTYEYYTDGVKTATKTFLEVSSGYSSGDSGYMELNDYCDIDEAYILNVS